MTVRTRLTPWSAGIKFSSISKFANGLRKTARERKGAPCVRWSRPVPTAGSERCQAVAFRPRLGVALSVVTGRGV